MTASEIKSLLNLSPHPVEGGSFRRTYTSPGTVELPRGIRHHGTAIYYLLEAGFFPKCTFWTLTKSSTSISVTRSKCSNFIRTAPPLFLLLDKTWRQGS
jgi:predicted cupin superfamily sugar epimerase